MFTNRAVLTSIGFTFGGILASSFFNFIELLLYESFGSAIFQIATVPNVILASATFGGFIGFFVSRNRAAKRWGEEQLRGNTTKFPDKLPAGTPWKHISLEFIEKQSAKLPSRPVFDDMIARVERGEAQGIVCWKLDRLSRNPVDSGKISWLLQQGVIQHIKTPERSYYGRKRLCWTNAAARWW